MRAALHLLTMKDLLKLALRGNPDALGTMDRRDYRPCSRVIVTSP